MVTYRPKISPAPAGIRENGMRRGKGGNASVEPSQTLWLRTPKTLPCHSLDRCKRISRAVVEFIYQASLQFGRNLLLPDVSDLDDGADGLGRVVLDWARHERDGIEGAILVNENLLPAYLVVLRECAVDGALLEGEGASVRIGMMDDVVQRAIEARNLVKRVAGQLFGGAVHINAVLTIIHEEDRNGCVV